MLQTNLTFSLLKVLWDGFRVPGTENIPAELSWGCCPYSSELNGTLHSQQRRQQIEPSPGRRAGTAGQKHGRAQPGLMAPHGLGGAAGGGDLFHSFHICLLSVFNVILHKRR